MKRPEKTARVQHSACNVPGWYPLSASSTWAELAQWRHRMAFMVLLLLSLQTGLSQETVESRAFRAAVESFEMKAYERAQREFRQFVETFPQSALLPEAVLLQARSALNQTNLAGGIALLKASATKAGPLADQYQYRLANAYLQSSNYLEAAQSFLFITRELTNSPLLLEASHGEA